MVTFNRNIPDYQGRTGCVISQWESPMAKNNHGRPIEKLKDWKGPITVFMIIVFWIAVISIILGVRS